MITSGYKEEVVDQSFWKVSQYIKKKYTMEEKKMQQERKGLLENIVLLHRMSLHFQTGYSMSNVTKKMQNLRLISWIFLKFWELVVVI